MSLHRSRGISAALRWWRGIEACLPLRGRWLGYFLIAAVVLIWSLGISFRWDVFLFRVYFASSPARPYSAVPPPRQGLDCQGRMTALHMGEVARSIRLIDLVIEISEDYGLSTRGLALDGPGCRWGR